MDDEVIGCGGSLLLLRESGAEIHIAYVTDSSAAKSDRAARRSVSAARRSEADRVSGFMGFASTNVLGFPDGQLPKHESAVTQELSKLIGSLQPELLFCPFPAEEHSDHMSCASAVGTAAMLAKFNGEIVAYEVCTPLWPNVAVDISGVAERKDKAIRLYESQISYHDYAAAALGLNRFRGLHLGVDFAEAFFMCKASGFAELTAMLDQIETHARR